MQNHNDNRETEQTVHWKRNLVFVWISQLFSITGFSLCLPFAPYYIQDLGVSGESAVKMWVALAAAAPAIGLAVMAPVWGILADRYGRKKMMLRANIGAVFILAAMAWAPTAGWFVFLRLVQGFLTGTMNAALTFVSSYSPRDRQGFALGAINSAVFSGVMLGPLVGGLLADAFGYRAAFLYSSVLVLISVFCVMFGVREKFEPPAEADGEHGGRLAGPAGAAGPALSIILLICLSSFVRRFDQPILPLFIQDLHGSLQGVARLAGIVFGCAAAGAIVGGILLGKLADRWRPPAVGKTSTLAAGAFQFGIGLITGFAPLVPLRVLMIFCAAGLDPVFLAWLARVTPESKRGIVFGWSVTAKSLGWSVSALASGAVAVSFSNRAVFFVGAALFMIMVPAISIVADRVRRA
jgi:DHA1 family multidrug resistance protein-like MFS transporter